MALFDRFTRGWHVRRRRPLDPKAWWEVAEEFPPEALYDPMEDFVFDPLGSYTGMPADGGEPEQDADDL